MRRFFETTLGQILAIIVCSSAVTFLLFLVLLSTLFNVPPPPPEPWPVAYRIASLAEVVNAVPESLRSDVIARAQRSDMSMRLTQAPALCSSLTRDARDLRSALQTTQADLSDEISVHTCLSTDSVGSLQVLLKLGDQFLEIRIGRLGSDQFAKITFPFAGALLFLCGAVASMSAWAVWRVTGPLRRLSETVDTFGRDFAVATIREEGPLEIRRAAHAFNAMQERITRSIRDRTRMLAAISHDLRTPLTRMRLQLETRSTGIEPRRLLRDVLLMQSMVSSALAFLSAGFDSEEKEWVDLSALLSTLCDEFEEAGNSVSYDGPEHIRLFCRPNAITRAVTNLVDNGCEFGQSVIVTASIGDGVVVVEVEDDGPGIPAERLQEVLEPFVRLDPARSGHPGSVGLGLSIVKEIVETHGGMLELRNRQPTGLLARMVLPAGAEQAALSVPGQQVRKGSAAGRSAP